MPEADEVFETRQKLDLLERHVAEQDAEIWRLTQRVDQLTKFLRQQSEQLQELSGRTGGDIAPADEKPPHY